MQPKKRSKQSKEKQSDFLDKVLFSINDIFLILVYMNPDKYLFT